MNQRVCCSTTSGLFFLPKLSKLNYPLSGVQGRKNLLTAEVHTVGVETKNEQDLHQYVMQACGIFEAPHSSDVDKRSELDMNNQPITSITFSTIC